MGRFADMDGRFDTMEALIRQIADMMPRGGHDGAAQDGDNDDEGH